jgi:hypothetical protein
MIDIFIVKQKGRNVKSGENAGSSPELALEEAVFRVLIIFRMVNFHETRSKALGTNDLWKKIKFRKFYSS